MSVETYSHVMHIVSSVSGELREDVGAMDALRSILPAGTLSGAPKVRAMEIIDELEPVKRGGYGGAIGWLSYTGDLDTCIHIRTVVVKDGARPRAGRRRHRGRRAARLRVRRVRGQGARRPARPRAGRRAARVAMNVLVVDNYDSFTYNLVQYLGELGAEVDVVRNDAATVDELLERRPDRVVVSPGPCTPDEAGISVEAMRRFPEAGRADARRLPGPPVAGPGLRRARDPARARARQDDDDHPRRPGVYAGLEDEVTVGRYHSLVVEEESLPDCFEPTAHGGGVLMGDPPPRAARRGRAVPSRVRPDRRGQAPARELPECPTRSSLRPSTPWRRAARSPRSRRAAVLREIMDGEAGEVEIAAFLIALRTKGETEEELAGLAATMRELATPVRCDRDDLLDTAGTGRRRGRPSTSRPPRR